MKGGIGRREYTRNIRRDIGWLERIKTWQLIIVLVLSLFVAATFLRLNRVGINARTEAVVSADQSGNQLAIQERLFDLQQYAATHMNAKPEDVYLVEQYKRDVGTIIEAARSANDTHSSNILKLADDACRPHYSGYSMGYVQCVAAEQAKYPASPDPNDSVHLPDPLQYRHSFTSPLWSADFAGWSLLVTGLILVAIVLRLLMLGILRFLLKRHYQAI
jgi:hypothetical protein